MKPTPSGLYKHTWRCICLVIVAMVVSEHTTISLTLRYPSSSPYLPPNKKNKKK